MLTLKRIFLYGLASLGGITFVAIIFVSGLALKLSNDIRPLPPLILLDADLSAGVTEVRKDGLISVFDTGPLLMGKDTHALSDAAHATALRVLLANDVETRIQEFVNLAQFDIPLIK